jgi:diacylglycerol kinase (ATP)
MRIILNPASRHGAGARMRPRIERVLRERGVDFEIVETSRPGHALELAREAAAAGVGQVVAAGGDGTVHEVVNGLMAVEDARSVLGLLPIGTGNDSVKMVPGTRLLGSALDALAAGHTARLDVGVAEWDGGREYFINAMGTGIDVEVVRRMQRSRLLPGAFVYTAALLRALAVYRPLRVSVTIGATTIDEKIMNLAVCNGPCIGGSFRICPDARPDDGQLDLCMIGEMSLARNARMVPRVLSGTHAGQPGVSMLRGQTVHLRLPDGQSLWFQLDGELREAADGAAGIRLGIRPAALSVIHGVAGATTRSE